MTDNADPQGVSPMCKNDEQASADTLPKQCSSCSCGKLIPIALTIIGVLVIWLLLIRPMMDAFHERATRMQCPNNLKLIGLAMSKYEQAYHSLPPAFIADSNGRPLYSWRVLLLPFLEQDELYNRVKLDEPWDSPHNRSVLQDEAVAQRFHCPWADNPKDETTYVMIVGPNMISDGPHSVRFADIKDGLSNTIMIAEVKNSGIHWAEPRDLDFREMSFRVNDPDGKGISSNHHGVANVGFADGSVRTIGGDFDPKLLKALITINGGEDVSWFNNW